MTAITRIKNFLMGKEPQPTALGIRLSKKIDELCLENQYLKAKLKKAEDDSQIGTEELASAELYTLLKQQKRGNVTQLSKRSGISRTSIVRIMVKGEWENPKLYELAASILEENKKEILDAAHKKDQINQSLRQLVSFT